MHAVENFAPGESRLISQPDPDPSSGEILPRFRRVGGVGAYVLISIVQGDIAFDGSEFHRLSPEAGAAKALAEA